MKKGGKLFIVIGLALFMAGCKQPTQSSQSRDKANNKVEDSLSGDEYGNQTAMEKIYLFPEKYRK